jgi:hypothetical protein
VKSTKAKKRGKPTRKRGGEGGGVRVSISDLDSDSESRSREEEHVVSKQKRRRHNARAGETNAAEAAPSCARTRPWIAKERLSRPTAKRTRRRAAGASVDSASSGGVAGAASTPDAVGKFSTLLSSEAAAAEGNAKAIETRSREQRISTRRHRVGRSAISSDVFVAPEALTSEVRVRFGRSDVQGWGVYSVDSVRAGDMILEYRGELIRSTVADARERRRLGKGVDDYMFRISKDVVIDATTAGSLARFLNHSCEVRLPRSTAALPRAPLISRACTHLYPPSRTATRKS